MTEKGRPTVNSQEKIWSHVLVEWGQMDPLFQPISGSSRTKVYGTYVGFMYKTAKKTEIIAYAYF